MPRHAAIPDADADKIRQHLLEGRKLKDIASEYGLKSAKTVSRFVKRVLKTDKYTDISNEEIIKILKDDLQTGFKQTMGRS